MNVGVCEWKREQRENNQKERTAGLLRVLAHILTSPAPIPALPSQGRHLDSFFSFTLGPWLGRKKLTRLLLSPSDQGQS